MGQRVYYHKNGGWRGPAKVMFQDGKIVWVRHGSFYSRISTNRLVDGENALGVGNWGENSKYIWNNSSTNEPNIKEYSNDVTKQPMPEKELSGHFGFPDLDIVGECITEDHQVIEEEGSPENISESVENTEENERTTQNDSLKDSQSLGETPVSNERAGNDGRVYDSEEPIPQE